MVLSSLFVLPPQPEGVPDTWQYKIINDRAPNRCINPSNAATLTNINGLIFLMVDSIDFVVLGFIIVVINNLW